MCSKINLVLLINLFISILRDCFLTFMVNKNVQKTDRRPPYVGHVVSLSWRLTGLYENYRYRYRYSRESLQLRILHTRRFPKSLHIYKAHIMYIFENKRYCLLIWHITDYLL